MKKRTLILSICSLVILSGGSLFVTSTALASSSPTKAQIQARIVQWQRQHNADVLKRLKAGEPASPSMTAAQLALTNQPLAAPYIMSAKVNYPPISGGIFICTGYRRHFNENIR